MSVDIQFIVDNNGQKQSVIVPYKQWIELQKQNEKLKNKLQVLTGIQDALDEVKLARSGKKKLTTLLDFLNESKD